MCGNTSFLTQWRHCNLAYPLSSVFLATKSPMYNIAVIFFFFFFWYSLKSGICDIVRSLTIVFRMSSEVCQLCLEALTPLAEQCAKAQETDSPLFLATRHFLKVRCLVDKWEICLLNQAELSTCLHAN